MTWRRHLREGGLPDAGSSGSGLRAGVVQRFRRLLGLRRRLGVAAANGRVRDKRRWLVGGSVGRFRWGAWLYICAVMTAAVVVITVGPFTGIDWAQIAALGLLLIVSESTATV